MPTLNEIKNEILEGPLKDECLVHWDNVFNDSEPLKTKLINRQGMLIPDSAYSIYQILNDNSKFQKQNKIISRGAFLASIAQLTGVIASLPDIEYKAWSLLIQLATGGDDFVNLGRPEIIHLFTTAAKSNLITNEIKETILNQGGYTPQSRLEQLNWNITVDEIQQSRKV